MKTTPIEVVIPDWAKWIAQDEDRWEVIYQIKPKPLKHINVWYSNRGKVAVIAMGYGPPNPNWGETLRRVE